MLRGIFLFDQFEIDWMYKAGGASQIYPDKFEEFLAPIPPAERGDLDYLVFECLAERTIALAQQAKSRDATAGYDPMLEARFRAVLPACRRQGIRIITNMGAANPAAAATAARACAREIGLHGLQIATISGSSRISCIHNPYSPIGEY